MTEVFLIDGARTAFTSFGGSFASVSAIQLGVATAAKAIEKSKIDADQIDAVFYGNVIATGKDAAYTARHIALLSLLEEEVPALTLNRLCGSGLQSVISGAQEILLGDAKIVLAGGTENMSQSPYSNFTERSSHRMLGGIQYEDMLQATLTDQYTGVGMGVTAENLAEKYEITREEQDEYASLSHKRAAEAQVKGLFVEEIAPVHFNSRKGVQTVEVDEHIKADTTAEKIAALKPAFKSDGTVTAANSSGINDGAASVILAGTAAVAENNLQPIAKIISWASVGVDPSLMGIGPVPAIQKALAKANLTLEDIDLFEINEAFAAQYLAVEKELGLDRNKTNVNGGAIALGHPVGASGTRVLLAAAYELKRRQGKYAVASLCIGGGQGIAVIIESV
ncbi:acetyl-CoA acetyltransferase [Kurthia zopfii]|uniref:acetyl-CoA C-acetyltransferase n=1 Tax=Kurthia zopfii TaxID=1650 RepID=A0A8B4QA97_9BACL|nr:acetyl-CoA C-acetyltransferase [Kurthia zopfii]PWI21548.1 acetyl-CoA C-acyltransferase [Kurthia zopfii]TDR34976.1 acetyl-CoA C-acetyltransferase [Kurthia zopfii]GEK31483.1 acetyl-CoA acetyltransferase [Kurthia zopfii]STX09634.1 Acetyl-CoA acetyltransferase [Kurthia zopfii]